MTPTKNQHPRNEASKWAQVNCSPKTMEAHEIMCKENKIA